MLRNFSIFVIYTVVGYYVILYMITDPDQNSLFKAIIGYLIFTSGFVFVFNQYITILHYLYIFGILICMYLVYTQALKFG